MQNIVSEPSQQSLSLSSSTSVLAPSPLVVSNTSPSNTFDELSEEYLLDTLLVDEDEYEYIYLDEDGEEVVDRKEDEEGVANASLNANESSNAAEVIQAKKKKYIRRRKKRFFPVYRVVKSDIRRNYLTMYINVMNSHDINLVASFLNTFTTPNIQYYSNFLPGASQTVNSEKTVGGLVEYTGRMQRLAYIKGMFELVPDFIYRMTDPVIRTWSQSKRCQVECDLEVYGTIVHMITLKQLAAKAGKTATAVSKEQKKQQKSASTSGSSAAAGAAPINPYTIAPQSAKNMNVLDLNNKATSPPSQGVDAYLKCRLVFHVNEDKLIDFQEIRG